MANRPVSAHQQDPVPAHRDRGLLGADRRQQTPPDRLALGKVDLPVQPSTQLHREPRLKQVRRHHRRPDAPEPGEILGIHHQRHRPLRSRHPQPLEEPVGDHPVPVVGDHHHVAPLKGRLEPRRQIGVDGGPRARRLALVEADHVLIVGQDPQLVQGLDPVVRHQPGVRHAPLGQCRAQQPRRRVHPDQTHQVDLRPERPEVGRHVRRPTRRTLLRQLSHHRHRPLGAEPRGRALQIAVQHHVADDQRPQPPEAAHDLNGPGPATHCRLALDPRELPGCR